MYVTAVPNRNSPPAILLRESYRDGDAVKNRTLANLSHWEVPRIEALRQVLKGATPALAGPLGEAFEIVRSRPHGHVAVVLGMMRQLRLDRLIAPKPSRERDLCVAMIAARILSPASKLATSRRLAAETKDSTLGELCGVEEVDEDDLYAAMDFVLTRQASVEKSLARRHLADGALVLYDLTSTYFEGHHCPLARRGHSRDGKQGTLQIVFGLLTDADGRPIAVEVFEGNTGDPKTVATQIEKLRARFGLKRVVLVGDRGMITDARIREDLVPAKGIQWITTLRAPAIRKLVESKALQLSLFDEKDLAEIRSPDFPDDRLIVCRNPLLAEERARKRKELLASTERDLEKVMRATRREKRALHGQAQIGLRVGRVLGRYKMAKHYRIEIRDDGFTYGRDEASIERESALDGIYVVRTNVSAEKLPKEDAVRCYKRLAVVERAFRSMKTVDLHVRPIGHTKPDRVRAHVLLCMLAYYVEWHLRRALAPILFDDDDKAAGEALRSSVVAPAMSSPRAQKKANTKRTVDDLPVHSFQTLLADLATIVKNRIQPKAKHELAFDIVTRPTPSQARALELLRVRV